MHDKISKKAAKEIRMLVYGCVVDKCDDCSLNSIRSHNDCDGADEAEEAYAEIINNAIKEFKAETSELLSIVEDRIKYECSLCDSSSIGRRDGTCPITSGRWDTKL